MTKKGPCFCFNKMVIKLVLTQGGVLFLPFSNINVMSLVSPYKASTLGGRDARTRMVIVYPLQSWVKGDPLNRLSLVSFKFPVIKMATFSLHLLHKNIFAYA